MMELFVFSLASRQPDVLILSEFLFMCAFWRFWWVVDVVSLFLWLRECYMIEDDTNLQYVCL